MKELTLFAVLQVFEPGDGGTWQQEIDWLWDNHQEKMDMLTTSIQETGVQEPVLLGADGRIWDGHHRIAAALKLGLHFIPVKWSGE